MKLNNKGFAITAVLYGLLILFVILVSSYLVVLSAKKNRVDNIVSEIEKNYTNLDENQSTTLADYITNLYAEADKTVVTNNRIQYNYATAVNLMNDRLGGTTADYDGGNIRYYGAPNNYIYFNCSDYTNQSASTCERWRIIGVFAGKVKIVNIEGFESSVWDNKNTSTGAETDNGKNDWADSVIMKKLNPGYESETSGSIIYNSKIKNSITGNMIAETTWNIGGYSTSKIFANEAYVYERGTTVYPGRSTTWTGKIALPYPSDYGYAIDFQYCSENLYELEFDQVCLEANWLNPMNNNIDNTYWLLMHNSASSYEIWIADYDYHGSVIDDYIAKNDLDIVPALYLKSDVSIVSGNGSKELPYQISNK